ncbi:MAG: NAD-dependent epimerase/dehydratase family protein [Planctomycetes bacterium]|nr:NAD-dependent epimerase/dehydratase family protein [Planctomycetota bacterium]
MSVKAPRVLITGGLGFLGRHIVKELLNRAFELTILDLPGSPNALPQTGSKPCRIVWGNFADTNVIREACEGQDVLLHLAWGSLPSTAQADLPAEVQNNVAPSARLFEAACKAGIGTIVFASSGGTVYGDYRRPVTEMDLPLPMGGYGLAKLSTEHYLRLNCLKGSVRGIVLRFANPYGREQDHASGIQGLLDVALSRARLGLPILVFGDGSVVRDFFHVEDLADSVRLVLEAQHAPGFYVYNVGSGAGCSIRDALAALERATGRPLNLRFEPSRSFDVPYNVLDIRKIEQATQWKPRIDLESGLRKVWQARLAE